MNKNKNKNKNDLFHNFMYKYTCLKKNRRIKNEKVIFSNEWV